VQQIDMVRSLNPSASEIIAVMIGDLVRFGQGLFTNSPHKRPDQSTILGRDSDFTAIGKYARTAWKGGRESRYPRSV
jgi:hypothetical protein